MRSRFPGRSHSGWLPSGIYGNSRIPAMLPQRLQSSQPIRTKSGPRFTTGKQLSSHLGNIWNGYLRMSAHRCIYFASSRKRRCRFVGLGDRTPAFSYRWQASDLWVDIPEKKRDHISFVIASYQTINRSSSRRSRCPKKLLYAGEINGIVSSIFRGRGNEDVW